MIDPSTLPPSSLILAYWTAARFSMGAKRLSEYRDISGEGRPRDASPISAIISLLYGRKLDVSCLLYAMISAFFIAAFLVKYRLEYIVAMPFIAVCSVLPWLALLRNSIAQRPEECSRSKRLVASLCLAVSRCLARLRRHAVSLATSPRRALCRLTN